MNNKDILYRGIRQVLSLSYLESYQRGLLNKESINYIVGFCDSNTKTETKFNNKLKIKEFHVIYRGERYIFSYNRFKAERRKVIDSIRQLSVCKEE